MWLSRQQTDFLSFQVNHSAPISPASELGGTKNSKRERETSTIRAPAFCFERLFYRSGDFCLTARTAVAATRSLSTTGRAFFARHVGLLLLLLLPAFVSRAAGRT